MPQMLPTPSQSRGLRLNLGHSASQTLSVAWALVGFRPKRINHTAACPSIGGVARLSFIQTSLLLCTECCNPALVVRARLSFALKR